MSIKVDANLDDLDDLVCDYCQHSKTTHNSLKICQQTNCGCDGPFDGWVAPIPDGTPGPKRLSDMFPMGR